MKISQWPTADRPREKLLSQGARALTDTELLALLLQCGMKGKTALDLARELLSSLGGLKKLSQTSAEAFSQVPGLGKAKYALLRAALELGKRCVEEDLPIGEKLSNTQATKRFLSARLGGHSREVFACLFLNNHHHMLAFEELFQGSLTEATVYPRELIKSALTHNAAKLILAHNHPSGKAAPSQADKDLTWHLKKALALVDIQVIDHIVVGQKDHFSFAEAGLL